MLNKTARNDTVSAEEMSFYGRLLNCRITVDYDVQEWAADLDIRSVILRPPTTPSRVTVAGLGRPFWINHTHTERALPLAPTKMRMPRTSHRHKEQKL
jgi:hypothetical protein